jgi:GNAT superfamily N-acetyltransferase
MNELSKFLVEQILLEDENPIKKTVVIYVGRFQPFHKGHYGTYSHLVKKFGKDNVFIGTSDKVEKPKSPFNFKEKVKIMTTMFGIPPNKIHQVKNPYAPTEILSKFDENTTAFITVVGEKDKNRLGGKYFQPYKGDPTEGYKDRGYVYAAPSSGGGVSGTEVRNGLSLGSDEQKEEFFKGRAYGKFNKTIFKMITDKLNEGIIEIPKEVIEEWLIKEGTFIGTGQVDDGPNFFFPNYDVFSRINAKRAAKIGYEVVNMIMSKEIEDYYDHPTYPDGPVQSVSYFPAGVIGKTTATNQVDIYSSKAYSDWYKHITRKAALVGYELVQSTLTKVDTKQDMKQSDAEAKDVKKVQKEFETSINEAITLPVEIGDTILMGKFKNKKVVVKSIGKDEYGMPTINGKKVATFRLMNEGFETIFEDETEDEKYTHIGYGKFKEKGKEKDPNSPTFQKDDSGKYTELGKGGETKPQEPQGKSLTKGSAGKSYIKQLPDNDPAKKQPEQDNWEKVDDKKNYYKSVRKYTDEELENETGEYFENETTQKTAPNAFKDKRDMVEKMKNAKPVYLSSEEMENMNNTDMGGILNSENPKQTAQDLADEYGKDISWQYKSIEKNEKVPAPIALRDKNGDYHLLAGNTRAMAFTAAGKKLPIKVIDYDGEFQWQENESINEIAGTEVKCEKCNHSWEIESEDTEKYLCHSCGWDSQKQEYDFDAFDSWKEKMGIQEMSKSTLNKIEKYAEKQLSPEDIEFTKHFFDRVNDPRNGKEISDAELTGFFKRLSRFKKQFKDFLEKYQQIVVKDKRTDINIPFVKQANQIIAKTVMRKDNFQTSNPVLSFESGGNCDKPLPNETEDQFRTRCFGYNPLTPPPTGMIRGENKEKFDRVKYYEKYYRNLTPSDFNIILEDNNINIEITQNKKISEIAPHGYPDQKWMDNHEKEMKKLRTQLDKQQKKVYGEGIENTLSNKHKVDLDIYEYPTHLELRRIVVPQDQRGKGIGSKVMQDLIKYAQQNNKDLFTTPSSDFGGSKSRLVQFYKSFGFKDNKGSNKDFRSRESMVRLSENHDVIDENIIGLIFGVVSLAIARVFGRVIVDVIINTAIDSASIVLQKLKMLVKPEDYIKFLKKIQNNKQFNQELLDLLTKRKDLTNFSKIATEIVKLPTFTKELNVFVKSNNLSKDKVEILRNTIEYVFARGISRNKQSIIDAVKRKFPDLKEIRLN